MINFDRFVTSSSTMLNRVELHRSAIHKLLNDFWSPLHFRILVNPGIVPFFSQQVMLIENSTNELFLRRRMITAVEAKRANS